MQSNDAQTLWAIAIVILFLLGMGWFVSWVQNSYKNKEQREEEKRIKVHGRRADIALLRMLIISSISLFQQF